MVGFHFSDLPPGIDEIILRKLPVRDIYKTAMFVCREWRDIVCSTSFRRNLVESDSKQHLLIGFRGSSHPHCSALMQVATPTPPPTKESDSEPDLKLKIDCEGLPRTGRIIFSCNGLILVHLKQKKEVGKLQIMNLITRACVIIPEPPSSCSHHNSCTMGLGYDPITKAYKVVHLHTFEIGFEVLTVSASPESETWRVVPGPWSNECSRLELLETLGNKEPVNTGRSLHWTIGFDRNVASIDLGDDRNPFRTHFPAGGGRDMPSLVEMNGELAFLHNASDWAIDVWIMGEDRNWSMKQSIVGDGMTYLWPGKSLPKLSQFRAVCCLRDGEVVVLVLKHLSSHCLYLYNTRNGVLQKLRKEKWWYNRVYIPHVTSLLHWTDRV